MPPRNIESVTWTGVRSSFEYLPSGHLKWRRKPQGRVSPDLIAGGSPNKSDGYIYITYEQCRTAAHRWIWFYHHGEWPTQQIDHINHDRTDNRIENLRLVSLQENRKNQTMRATNTSGHTGVYWAQSDKRWRAQIQVDGKMKYLGNFTEMSDAIAARKAAEVEHGFHANHGS